MRLGFLVALTVAVAARAEPGAAILLDNGSFESAPGPSLVIGPDTTSLTSWGVYDGQIHVTVSSVMAAYDGDISVDLEGLIGFPPGLVEQGFATTVGEPYVVEFALAGNPAGAQGLKQLEVSLAVASAALSPVPFHTEDFTFDTTGRGPEPQNMGWVERSFTFVAQSSTTWLRFQSLQNTGFGPAIDAVSVSPVCASTETVAFPGLGTAGVAGELTIPSPHLSGGYTFRPFVGEPSLPGSTLRAYGELHPDYAGVPGIHTPGTNMGINEPGIFMERADGQTFGVCAVVLAEGESGLLTEVFNHGPFTADEQFVTLDGVTPGAQTIPLLGLDQVQELHSLGYTDVQWTGVCTCQGIACCPPAVSGVNGFCISGTSTGVGWSWEISGPPLPDEDVDVAPLASGATPDQLAAAFVDSINDWFDGHSSTSTAQVDGSDTSCFTVTHTPGFDLSVGPFGGAASCLVTGNPAGCSFNPLILDSRFVSAPTTVPGLAPFAGLVLGLGVASAGCAALWRRRIQHQRRAG